MTTAFTSYLEENGLADIVPRMEAQYLNPSPWAEKEAYEVEFDDILRQVRGSGVTAFVVVTKGGELTLFE